MRLSVTGATGFLGGRFVRLLRERGDDVIALTRRPSEDLRALGCTVAEVDLADSTAVGQVIQGSEKVVHIAGQFELGVPRTVGREMIRGNLAITKGVLSAAISQGIGSVYVSTINVLGDTRGMVVDETYVRPSNDRPLSFYEESKQVAHEWVTQAIREGAPITVVMPSAILGPGDHSVMGEQLWQAANGKLRAVMLAALGVNVAHVDDIAQGLLLATDARESGEQYLLGGDNVVFREALRQAAKLGGNRLPFEIPTFLLKAVAPLGPLFMPRLGLPPNLRELIAVADGHTYWVHDGKARRELGYRSRPLEHTLRDLGHA